MANPSNPQTPCRTDTINSNSPISAGMNRIMHGEVWICDEDDRGFGNKCGCVEEVRVCDVWVCDRGVIKMWVYDSLRCRCVGSSEKIEEALMCLVEQLQPKYPFNAPLLISHNHQLSNVKYIAVKIVFFTFTVLSQIIYKNVICDYVCNVKSCGRLP